MEMQFMWVGDKDAQEMYKLIWHPGQENFADYQSKHHVGTHHVNVRPYYLHMDNSPRFLLQAFRLSTLKGCVGTLKDGYVLEFGTDLVFSIRYWYGIFGIAIPIPEKSLVRYFGIARCYIYIVNIVKYIQLEILTA